MRKTPTSKQVGEAEGQSGHKPFPQHGNPQLGGTQNPELLPEELSLKPTFDTLTFTNCTWDKAPKHPALKANKAHPQDPQSYSELIKWSLKGLRAWTQQPSTEAADGEASRLYMKEA